MEIAQLCKIAYNHQLQQSIYLSHKKKRCLKYGRCTHFGRAKRSNHDAHLHSLIGFKINKNLPVHDLQKYLQVKMIKNKQATLFCKLFIYTHIAQSNYGWNVLNIVQTYQSNLSHLYICFACSSYGYNF